MNFEHLVAFLIFFFFVCFFSVTGYRAYQEQKITNSHVCELKQALVRHWRTVGRYPTEKEGFSKLILTGIWKKAEIPKNPRGKSYFFRGKNLAYPSIPKIFSASAPQRELHCKQ